MLDAIETRGNGHAAAIAKEASDRCAVVIALGGDGTANEVINGIAGSLATFACVPAGSTNVIARMLGMPRGPESAAARLSAATTSRFVDLGQLDGRYFAASAGVGLDASILRRIAERSQTRLGPRHWRHLAAGVQTFVSEYVPTPPRIACSVDGVCTTGVSAFVQNGQHYSYFGARPLELARGRSLDDGLLAAAVLTRARARDVVPAVARLLSRRLEVGGHRYVEVVQTARTLDVVALDGSGFPTSVDGEYAGEAVRARLGVRPRALRVLTP